MSRPFTTYRDAFGKVCTRCKDYHLFADFAHDKNMSDGYTPQCNACRSVTAKDFRNSSPVRKYQMVANAHNARCKKLGIAGTITGKQLVERWEYQDKKCHYCGGDISEYFEIDHMVPIDRGGTNHIYNIVCACGECNGFKRTQYPYEMRWWWDNNE